MTPQVAGWLLALGFFVFASAILIAMYVIGKPLIPFIPKTEKEWAQKEGGYEPVQ